MSKLDAMTILAAQSQAVGNALKIGDDVVVDGLQGRGYIVKREGRRLTILYRDGMYVSRDQMFVHPISGNRYKSQYSSLPDKDK